MFAARRIPYKEARTFSRLVLDYLDGSEKIRPFFNVPPTLEGIRKVIEIKKQQGTDRRMLHEMLLQQYAQIETTGKVKNNLEQLLSPDTFTVCTAHQPNLFTGPLYFIYKILHTIKLAEYLQEQLPENHFIPVYYMGSEDADFAELNHTYVEGKKIEWKKVQKGAVGRMLVDQSLIQLIDELEGQLYAQPFGKEVIDMLRISYVAGKTIQQATFELVNELYGQYGLVVLIPDHPALKSQMKSVFLDDLFAHTSSDIVSKTSEKLAMEYIAQAHPREINLFYLKDDVRERIIRTENGFSVHQTNISFSEEEMRAELECHPERFSPNVILRGLYQETILPNLAFIGGGGELAYWLQLKGLFDHYNVVYPVLVLRNSFLVVEKKWKEKIHRLGFSTEDLFMKEDELMNQFVSRHSSQDVSLNGKLEKVEELFNAIGMQASAIDPTLSKHVAAIQTRALKTLQELEKKMLRAEKRKFTEQQRSVHRLREALFPNNGLQERVENFSGFYARWGRSFIDILYRYSPVLEQEFTILAEE